MELFLFKKETKKKWLFIGALFLVVSGSFFFGSYRLGKKAVVDEPLWTFGRIQKYWNNIEDRELEKTMISDKPGITVALISGIGMKIENPFNQKSSFWKNKNINPERSKKMEKVNLAFRYPILIFSVLSLIPIFFLLRKIAGNLASILSITAIGFSSLMMGIFTIVNPDSLLWAFTSISILSFLVYLKDGSKKFIYLSGFSLGLALLTKYVANILFIFFPLLIFLDYSINDTKKDLSIPLIYLKKKFRDFLILSGISLLTVYLLLPALWKNPFRIRELTIFSQAFQKISIIFIITALIFFLDIIVFKGIISRMIFKFLNFSKKFLTKGVMYLFLFFSLGALANVYSGMKFIDFEAILASPKTTHNFSSVLEMMLANFYPLIFGISPILLFFLVFVIFKNALKKDADFSTIFYLTLFIIIYYSASIFNEVEATIRYQIMIIPLALILAGIGASKLFKKINRTFYSWIIIGLFVFIPILSLWQIKPFYFSYASEILPKKYSINPKDMGEGSYEAAQYLNSLPEAEKLVVWSDKDGVCSFFIGSCFNYRDPENFEDFDYFVVSSGRKTRTSRLILQRIGNGKIYRYRIDKLYEAENANWKLELGKRTSNYLKVFSFDKLQK